MRQAGRYLPEYRALRARAKSFLELCYTPEFAMDVTLQPVRRFDFDAAILFADILLVPQSLGQDLAFREGEGPQLDPIRGLDDIDRLSIARSCEILAPVINTVRLVRQALPERTTLIGFAGGPWTVATYMVAGHGTADQADARLWAYRDPSGFERLIDLLVTATTAYLLTQIEAGADAVQIFESWAGSLPEDQFQRWVIEPTERIVRAIKQEAPGVPIIGFARGAGVSHLDYGRRTGVDALGVETQLPIRVMGDLADQGFAVQGNLDPLCLVAGGNRLDDAIDRLRAAMHGRRHIFNLGHGILPETPIDHVERLIARVRQGA
jgi:uroporphyrinogen decarboxylase